MDLPSLRRPNSSSHPLRGGCLTDKLTTPEVIASIGGRARGNFVLASHLASAVSRKQTLRRADLAELPNSLDEFYFDHIRRLQTGPPTVQADVSRVLGLLVALAEPMSAEAIGPLLSIESRQIEALLNSLEQFIVTSRLDLLRCYALYHRSFAE